MWWWFETRWIYVIVDVCVGKEVGSSVGKKRNLILENKRKDVSWHTHAQYQEKALIIKDVQTELKLHDVSGYQGIILFPFLARLMSYSTTATLCTHLLHRSKDTILKTWELDWSGLPLRFANYDAIVVSVEVDLIIVLEETKQCPKPQNLNIQPGEKSYSNVSSDNIYCKKSAFIKVPVKRGNQGLHVNQGKCARELIITTTDIIGRTRYLTLWSSISRYYLVEVGFKWWWQNRSLIRHTKYSYQNIKELLVCHRQQYQTCDRTLRLYSFLGIRNILWLLDEGSYLPLSYYRSEDFCLFFLFFCSLLL